MNEHADAVARTFLKEHMPWHKEIHVSILRNAIDDCVFSAAEDDFIRKALKDASLKRPTLRVLQRARPHMHNLVAEAQGWVVA